MGTKPATVFLNFKLNYLESHLDGSDVTVTRMCALGDFINCVDWLEVEDFRSFAQVIYPFLNVSFTLLQQNFSSPCLTFFF